MSFFKYNNKKVFYKDQGQGKPLVCIHGNSVSSKMHAGFVRKLKKQYRVISPDLPGHGRSERVDQWPTDFWYQHSFCIKELLDHLKIDRAVIMGYSGGALVAINLALENPERVIKVVADSFEGESSVDWFAENILEDREKDKRVFLAKIFWFMMHGSDWKSVVDKDSEIIYKHHKEIGKFFHKPLEDLDIPIMLSGTLKDRYLPGGVDKLMEEIGKKVTNPTIKIYKTGDHPACLKVGQEYIQDLVDFID